MGGRTGGAYPGGLSPRVRGNLRRLQKWRPARGSIPACAGEPRGDTPGRDMLQVYPRVCGGTGDEGPFAFDIQGLSPRVRGNLVRAGVAALFAGSIPACAGEPLQSGAGDAGRRVYPRVCGGTGSTCIFRRRYGGLSPRVRGNPLVSVQHRQRAGSIPACAGEPYARGTNMTDLQVYPRVCGGTCSTANERLVSVGLSPRVRGNRPAGLCGAVPGGSIPACAGEPVQIRLRRIARQVYPRVCGGTPGSTKLATRLRGLSPRVRGNLTQRRRDSIGPGSIPACAGEPSLP